ncbi:MAG TPA: ferric reductase-like transmembrane domain-containing protein [Anaeromyxobacter sp.]|nr:ferric reductase-like transmembrane domain-containing protein [Anaeromyxobacter sp.]
MTLTVRGLLRSALWLGLYLLLVLFPLPWLAAGPVDAFPDHLGAALGYVTLSILALEFVLTARFQVLAPPFGADVILTLHRGMAAVALLFALAHPLLMLPPDELAAWLDPTGVNWAGATALSVFLLLAALAAGRRLLRLPYVAWRWVHGLLALALVGLGLTHALGSRFLAHDPVTRAGLVVWVAGWASLLLWVRLARPLALLRRPYRVTGVRPEHGGAVTLVVDPEGHDGLRFRAGQFAWLTLGSSPFLGRERPFCFSGSAQRTPRLELTVKAVGPFTRRAQEVKPGTVVYLDGPLGGTSLDAYPDADRYFFVAAGIGVAPCVSMLRTLADRGDRRPHTILYGSATWEAATFREDLAELASRLDLKVVHVLARPPLGWLGETGEIGPELIERHLPRSGRRVCFVYGPGPMMTAAEAALTELGVPLDDVHGDRFEWA